MVAAVLQVPSAVSLAPIARADETSPKAAATEQEALKAAAESGEPVEVLAERGESRTVRALPNGRMEIEQHIQPIRTRKDGTWADIDTTLHRSGEAIVPAATAVGLRFSGGGSGPMVQMTRAGRKMALTWPQALPEPTVNGDTATYAGVLGDGVDLQLRAQADGFTHTLVVKTAEAAKDPRLAQLALALSAPGLSVTQEQASGVLTAKTAAGGGVFEAPSPVMWDSTKAPAGDGSATATTPQVRAMDTDQGPAEGAKTAPVKVAVADGKLTLTPDQNLLTAADTTFPVYIDPVWGAFKASHWGMVSSGYPSQSYYDFNGKSTEGVGRCEVAKDGNCVINQTKRLFYQVKLPSLKGRYVESVEFTAYETGAYDCKNPTSIQLWRTLQLKSYATWNNTVGSWNDGGAWGEQLTSRDVAYCSSTPVEFGGSTLREHVQSALDKGYGDITFGLKAYSESTMDWWKRFSDDAYLKIQYNNPPLQPDTDTMFADPGTKCVDAPDAKTVNDLSTVYAYLKDPDDEDKNKVQAQFTLHWANNADGSDWGPKWTSALTPAKTTGSRFSIKLPSTIPQKTKIGWGVRAWDGEQWGPWSYDGAQTGCYFYYDTSVPAKPTITSTDYPNDDAWHGAVGEPGQFHISDSAGVADRYEVTLNGGPTQTIATTGGAQRNAVLTPTNSGPNIVTVQAFAPSGQNGASVSYEFRANAGAESVARFGMDEDAGAAAVTAASPGTAAWLRGNAVLGGDGKNGTALTLDGAYGFAEAGLPQVDSTKSFTVSAWVKPTQTKAGDVLAQLATFQSGFILGMQADGKPVFKSASTDTGDGGGTWHVAAAGSPLTVGQWAHLTGVYDQSAAQMRLYVGGELAATASNAAPLASGGAFQIGRSFYNQGFLDYWPGSIDDVTVFSQALTGTQAQQLVAGTVPDGAGLQAHWKMDEPQGAPRVYSQVTPIKATLGSGATLGAAGQAGTALSLDGTTNGYAATDRPLVNTQRSFAVAAWVKIDGSATGNDFTALSAEGSNKSAFYLKYVKSTGKWVFARAAHDSDDAGWFQAVSKDPAQTGTWTHLVGVYDQSARKLRIYVNGEAGTDSPEVTSAWNATGGLQIGRAKYGGNQVDHWKGLIDDVRVYDRVLGPEEAEELLNQHPTLKARWILNTDGSGEPAGAPALALHNGAVIDPDAGFGWGTSGAGLMLGATGNAFAETAAPVVDTGQSFTIAGWVRNMGRPQQPATVFSQAGDNTNAFDLRYVPSEDAEAVGGWQIVMHNTDTTGATPITATHPKFIEGDWVHLAVVYDALRDRVSLYVNGQLNETSDNVSQQDQALGFEADNGGLQIGRNKLGAADGTEFWPDDIDDVWAYQGALTQEQIGLLAMDRELNTKDGP